MARKHILWGLAAPLSIILFILIPQLAYQVGAIARTIGYLFILGGASGLLVALVALRDNGSPRILNWCYQVTLAVCALAMLVWLFAPLWEAPNALGWGLLAVEAYAVGCFIAGALAVTGFFLTKPHS